MQEPDKEPRQDPEIETQDRPAESLEAPEPPRSSLADRLMNPESTPTSRRQSPAAPASAKAAEAAAAPESAPIAVEKPPVSSTSSSVRATPPRRFSSPNLDIALDRARLYIQVRYLIFLTTLLAFFVLTIIVGGFFIISLLGSSDWQKIGISGGVVAFLVLVLLFLQYRPARSFSSAATQVARLEATRESLIKSIEFWDRFLDERQQERNLEADDIAMAVTSMTTASRELLNMEIDLEVTPPRGSPTASHQSEEQGKSSSSPSQTGMPDPRRY